MTEGSIERLNDRQWRKLQAQQDFQHALSALTFFAEIPDRTTYVDRRRYRCYHDQATIAYCRPFTYSNGLPKLSLKELGIKPEAAEQALHERLVLYRNKVVAHTDADRMRLLMTSFEVSHGIHFPQIVEDEGFEFLDDVSALEIWLRRLIKVLAEFTFELAQRIPPGTRLLRDYLVDH